MSDPLFLTQTALAIGPDLGRVLDVVRSARLSALLTGRHGIGKSEYLEEFGRARGLGVHVLDLSLLEATDLTGLPYQADRRTHFAPPAHLPREDEGPTMLVLEELNRCDRSVRQPCLQLLTARRLNDYRLPEGCFVVACVNPAQGGYDVDELDTALASRFVRLDVTASRERWTEWARGADVRKEIVDFVERHPKAFDAVPPRSWAYASRLLHAALTGADGAFPDEALPALLGTVIGLPAATALVDAMRSGPADAYDALALLRRPDDHLARIEQDARDKRIDLLAQLADDLVALLRSPKGKKVLAASGGPDVLRAVLAPVPADLRERVERALPKA
jgi:hypothetical protein